MDHIFIRAFPMIHGVELISISAPENMVPTIYILMVEMELWVAKKKMLIL
jgi:hypothetical protein